MIAAARSKVIRLPARGSKWKRSKEIGTMAGKALTDEQMAALAEKFSFPVTERDFLDRALFLILASTGLRAAEICRLKFSERITTPDNKTAFHYVRKGGQRLITIPSTEALEAVADYRATAGIDGDYFFYTLPANRNGGERQPLTVRTLQRIVERWGGEEDSAGNYRPYHPHRFRHTVGQRLFDRKGSIAAQKKLGHSTPNTTAQFYTRPYYDGTDDLNW